MFHSFGRIFALGLALGCLSSAAAVAGTELVERQTTCATGLHLMIAGGCTIPCAVDEDSLLSTLVSNITTAFPGSDQYLVPYDGSEYQAAEATPIMIAAANAYFTTCPNTPVVFIGYSLGGIIVMGTLCGGLDASSAPNVLAAISYGEETFRYPESYDAGTCTTSAPLYPRNNTAQCAPFAPAIQSYCNVGDTKCCSQGMIPLEHFAYPNDYDVAATNFIKSRYAALNASSSSSSSSSVASSTASSSSSASSASVSASTTSSDSASTTVSGSVSTVSVSTATVSTTGVSTSTIGGSTSLVSTTTVSTATSGDSTSLVSSTIYSTTTIGGSTTLVSTTGVATTIIPASGSASATASTAATAASSSVASSVASASISSTTSYVEIPIPVSAIELSSGAYTSLLASVASAESVAVASASSVVVASLSSAGIVSPSSAEVASLVSSATAAAASAAASSAAAAVTTASYSNSSVTTASTPSSTVSPYTGGASRLSMPGFVYIQMLCRAWRSVASLVI